MPFIKKHIVPNLLNIAMIAIFAIIAVNGYKIFHAFATEIGATHLLSAIDISFVISCGLAVVLYVGYLICHYLFTEEGKRNTEPMHPPINPRADE